MRRRWFKLKWLIIVNPLACGGAAGRGWHRAEEMLRREGLDFCSRITSCPGETREIAAYSFSEGMDGLAVYGGDGTISDAASVLAGKQNGPVLASIPAGSGNDWMRSIGFRSPSLQTSIKAMKDRRFKRVDTGFARWDGGEKFILNSAGTGFDALVLKRTVSFRSRIPGLSYVLVMALSALLPPVWKAGFLCDGTEFYRGKYLTFTAGVGSFSGGGMRLSPLAVPDDGLLDGLCILPMNFFSIAMNLKRVFDGTMNTTAQARCAKGSSIRIEALDGRMLLEVDGDTVQPATGKKWLEFISVPESLTVLSPCRE